MRAGKRGRQEGGSGGGALGNASRSCGQTEPLGEMSCWSPRGHHFSKCLEEKKA